MHVDLEAGTDVATFVIFDPAAIGDHEVPGKWKDMDPTLAAWSADGRALVYSYASDGGARFRVFVDEDPPAEWRARSDCGVSGALLRVPSGLLVASGWEYVRPEDQRVDFSAPSAAGSWSSARIPPGDYVVEAFDVEWGSEPEERLREFTTRGERVAGGLFTALLVIGFYGVLAVPLVFLIAWFEGSLATAWRALEIMLLMHAAYWAVAVPVLVVLTRTRAWRRHGEAELRVAEAFPGYTVVCLRRRGDEGEFVPGRFGLAHVEPTRPASWDVEAPTEPRWQRWLGNVLSLLVVLLVFVTVAFVIALFMSFVQDPPW